jgi:glycosyltransferase involved in cell wall biosynthesis
MRKILVRGPALSQSGYGEHVRFLLRSLKTKQDIFDIYLINTNWGKTSWLWENTEERKWIDKTLQKTIAYMQDNTNFDISVQVTIPSEWERLAPYNIGVTAGTETTKISPQWVEKTKLMDKIIVVSEYSKFSFDNTVYEATKKDTQEKIEFRCTTPIDVVGFPHKKLKSKNIRLNLKHDFNFLVVASWIPRKNLHNTINWFIEEFKDEEVGLVLKTSLGKGSLRDRQVTEMQIKNICDQHPEKKCSIYLLHGDLKEQEMKSLYNNKKIKCLINIAHGEGFGLPVFEAASNSLPVIAPSWGGLTDFMHMPIKNKKGKYKSTAMFETVAYDVSKIQKEATWGEILVEGSQWCFPKKWSYKKSLRKVYKNWDPCKARANKLAKYIEKEYSEEVVFEKFCNAIVPNISDKDVIQNSTDILINSTLTL